MLLKSSKLNRTIIYWSTIVIKQFLNNLIYNFIQVLYQNFNPFCWAILHVTWIPFHKIYYEKIQPYKNNYLSNHPWVIYPWLARYFAIINSASCIDPFLWSIQDTQQVKIVWHLLLPPLSCIIDGNNSACLEDLQKMLNVCCYFWTMDIPITYIVKTDGIVYIGGEFNDLLWKLSPVLFKKLELGTL